MVTTLTPGAAWNLMVEGNARFLDGAPAHPNQDSHHRAHTAIAQYPMAALFGCSDSRLSAEIIFDLGLGDLFVVRNMGQIISSSVIASLEFATEILRVPLIVVLAHDSCGAVKAAINVSHGEGPTLPVHIRAAIETILPSVRRAREDGGLSASDPVDANAVGGQHLRDTISDLLTSSELVTQKIAEGKLAVVGATYTLLDGRVSADVIVGDL